eukprot:gene6068-10076_t
MKPLIKKTIQKKNKNTKILKSILDVKANEECYIIGTLFKEMKLKPNILEEYEKDFKMNSSQDVITSFLSDDDFLILEDEFGRVTLKAEKEQIDELISGVIVGIFGFLDENGEFVIKNFQFAEIQPQKSIKPKIENDVFVGFLSGIDVGSPDTMSYKIQLLVDYLSGNIGTTDEMKFISKISQIIIAGNSIYPPGKKDFREFDVRGSLKATKLESVSNELDLLDEWLLQLSSSLYVDVMPGEKDPSNPSIPQQPLHHCLFTKSSSKSSFRLVTNPHDVSIEGVNLLGISGQNVDDIKRYSTKASTLEIMEDTLKWAHLCPTAPDTLDCYPFFENDPFILKNSPHIYFVGNQDKFETKMISIPESNEKIRLISIPKFSTTFELVLVNLKNLETHSIKFD